MYQSITIIGNLGRDPEMRYTPDGKPVTNFSVAVNDRENTLWFRITAWGKLAELCNQYLTIGRQVMVRGELREPYAYLDKSGNPRANLEITAQTVKFLGGSTGQGEEAGQGEAQESIPF